MKLREYSYIAVDPDGGTSRLLKKEPKAKDRGVQHRDAHVEAVRGHRQEARKRDVVPGDVTGLLNNGGHI